MNSIIVNLESNSYRIIIEENSLDCLYKHIDVSRHAFIVSDKNVEKFYLEKVKSQFISSDHFSIAPGESSKSMMDLQAILSYMQKQKLDRNTLLIALGGGVVGDIAGLAASLYLRGIDFISIPTTTLSQIDSSVGGKVAVNLNGVKNVVGTFYHPKLVIIDPNTLETLANSQYNSGIVEAVKMGLLFDNDLFNLILNKDIKTNINTIIKKSLKCKKAIVEIDEKDLNQRQLLNFGHTLGHAIEAKYKYSHGQSVILGMIYTVKNKEIKKDLVKIAKKLNLLSKVDLSENLYDLMISDKKVLKQDITLVQVDEIGKGYLKKQPISNLWELLNVK